MEPSRAVQNTQDQRRNGAHSPQGDGSRQLSQLQGLETCKATASPDRWALELAPLRRIASLDLAPMEALDRMQHALPVPKEPRPSSCESDVKMNSAGPILLATYVVPSRSHAMSGQESPVWCEAQRCDPAERREPDLPCPPARQSRLHFASGATAGGTLLSTPPSPGNSSHR